MANYLPLPDGRYFELPEGVTDSRQAVSLAMQRFPELYQLSAPEAVAEPETGFIAGVKSGFENLKGDIGAIGAGLGIEGGAEYSEAQREKAGQIYRQAEFSEDPIDYVTGLLGQSAAYMAAPVLAAAAASTAPVSGALGLGATAAGLLGAGAASATQFTGSNLSRQLEEGTAPEDLQLGAAVAAAIPQAALDTAALRFIPGINKLVGKFGRELTKEESLKAARKLAEAGAAGLVKAGGVQVAKNAGVEGLTEAGQQVFERMQAGLDMMDEQARGEYIDNFIGGATLGGLFGAGSRIGAQTRAKNTVAQEEQRVADEQAAEEKRLADEAAAAEQTAFDQQVAGTMQQQVIPGMEMVENLPQPEQPVESAQLIEQRQYLQRVLEDNQQQMSDALEAQDMETYRNLRDQRNVASQELKATDGQLKELGVEDNQQQLQLQEQIAKEQAKLLKMAGPGFDPDKAARIEKRIADLQSQAPQQDMFGAKPQLLDLNARNEQVQKDATQAEMDSRQADLLGTIPKRDKPDPLRLLKAAMEVDDETRKQQAFDTLFENVFETGADKTVVPVPQTVTLMPRLDFKAANNKFNGMLKKVETLSNSMLASNRQKAEETREQINDIREEGEGYLPRVFDARAEQDTALNRFVETLTDIRAGVYFGADNTASSAKLRQIGARIEALAGKPVPPTLQRAYEDAKQAVEKNEKLAAASSTLEGLQKQANEFKAAYVRAALQEAALHRRAEGRPAITTDEALKAASDMDTALSEALEEISTRAPADRSDAYKETRIVLPAQMRSGQVVQSAVLETRDSRPLEERPFGAPRAAQEVIVEGLNVLPKIRDRLIGGRQTRVEKPVLRTQFAGQEAQKTAEARGETGGTPQQKLRRRRNYVAGLINQALERDIPERISTALEKALGVIETKDAARARLVDALEGNLPDNIRASMEAALDAIDKGVPSTALLDAAEKQASRIIRGMDSGKVSRDVTTKTKEVVPGSRAVSPPSKQGKSAVPPLLISKERVTGATTEEGTVGFEAVQELEEALLPAGTTAIDQREAGQKSLFAGPADKRREERELGVIRRSYAALMKSPAVRAGREAAEKIEGRLRLINMAQDLSTRYTDKQVELQNQITEIRRRISEAGWMAGASLKPMSASDFMRLKPEEYGPVMDRYNSMVSELDKQNKLLKEKRATATAGLNAQIKALEAQQKRVKEGANNFFAAFSKTDPSVFADPVFANEKASAVALFKRRSDILAEQRSDLQAAIDAAMMRVTAEMRAAKENIGKQADALEAQAQAALLKLEKAREAASEEGVTKEGLKAFDDTKKTINAQIKELKTLRTRAAEAIETKAVVAEAHRDSLVQFEFGILKKYEKELARAKAKLQDITPAEVKQLEDAAAEQRARAAKAETAARQAKESMDREQRAIEQRLLKDRITEGVDRIKITGGKKQTAPVENEDIVRFQKIMNSVDDVVEERKAAKGKRAIGPVTRTQSAAPASMRGGTEESKAGLGRTGTSQRLSEARGVKQRDVPITSAEMAAPADMSVEAFGKLSLEEQTAELNRRQMKADLAAIDSATRTITGKRGTKAEIEADKKAAVELGVDVTEKKWRQRYRAILAESDAKEAEAISKGVEFVEKLEKATQKNFDKETKDFLADDNNLRELSTAYDAPSFTPVKVNVNRALRSGDAVKAAELLAESGSTPFNRKLAGLLSGLLGDVRIEMASDLYVDGKRAAGNYKAREGVIQIDEEAVSEEVILHEMIHAATLRALKGPVDRLNDAQKAARGELESMFASVKNNTKLAREYGITSVEEFVAELMSNRVLQEKLASVKWTGGGNMVTRFINKVLAFLGLKEGVDFNKQATQNILNLFEKAMPMTEGRQIDNVASVLRGVFPNTEPKFATGVSKEAQAAAGRQVAQTKGFVDKFMSSLFSPSASLAWRTQLLDRFAPVEELLKKGVARGLIPDMQLFQTLYYMRFGEQVNQYVAQAANTGVVKRVKAEDGTYTFEAVEGDNISRIAETLRGAGIGNEQAAEKMFTAWMAGLRAGQGKIGWDKLNFKDPKKARDDWNTVNKDVQSNPQIKDAFESARKQYRQYNKDLLTFLSDSGAMSSDEAVRLSELDYVPFYRIDGDAVELIIDREKTVQIGNIKNQPYLKELVGGEDTVMPFFTSSLQNTRMILDMGMRNIQTKDVAYVLQKMGSAEIRKGSGPAGTNIVRFREDGEMKHAVIASDKMYTRKGSKDRDETEIPADLLVKGMEGIKTTIPFFVRAMSYPSNLLRKTVTIMPTYALRQAIRDPLNAWLVTGGNFTPIASSFKELAKMVGGKSETQSVLEKSGAISSAVFTGDKQDLERILRDKIKGTTGWRKRVAQAEGFAIMGDSSTRAVLYNMYREKGMTHMQALLGSLESMNFSRRGVSPSMQFMSMMVPFFNAQIQGMDVLWRAGRGQSLFQKEMNVQALMMKRGLWLAAGTIAYAALMQDDESYKNATPEQRALNWFIPLPGMEASLRVPIPFELGYAFKSIPEMVFNVAFGDQKAGDAAKAIGALVYQTVPIGMPQGVKPIVEVATNYSFFTGAPVESARMQNLAKGERFTPNTTEVAKMLSFVSGSTLSPIQVDHLIRGYTSTLGITLAQIPNVVIRPFTDQAERPTKLINEYPVIGTLFQPSDGRGIVNAAYDRIEEFQQAKSTLNTMIAEGRQAEAKAFAQKYSTEIALNSVGGSFRQQMGELAKLKRAVGASKTLTPDQKRDRIQEIKRLEIKLARRINEFE
jgi:hypothetical protein